MLLQAGPPRSGRVIRGSTRHLEIGDRVPQIQCFHANTYDHDYIQKGFDTASHGDIGVNRDFHFGVPSTVEYTRATIFLIPSSSFFWLEAAFPPVNRHFGVATEYQNRQIPFFQSLPMQTPPSVPPSLCDFARCEEYGIRLIDELCYFQCFGIDPHHIVVCCPWPAAKMEPSGANRMLLH